MDIVAEANGSYKRKQGGTSASFSKKVADGIKLSGDGASISLYPKIPTQVRQPVVTGEIGKLPLKSLLYSAENINSLDKKTVSYYYNDSTSLEYSLTYTGFKEDIVVSEYTGQTEYVFTLKTGGLTLTEDNGNFYLTDKNGNTKATLGQVIIFTADEKNNAFGRMSAVAVKENEEYTVTIHVDAEYLKDEKTVYPIRIDPTIELTENGTSLVEDVVVNSNDTVSHRTTEALRVGKNEDGTYSRILIKFNYDFGSFADGPLKIHRAYVEMRDLMCQTESMTVMSEMYIGTNWSEDADWSAIARGVHTHYMASMPINYNKGNGYTEKHRYSISVLDAVKYWVAEANNTPDYYQASPQGGIMIKAYDAVEQGTTPIQKYFASSQYAETAYRPSLSVTYYDTHTQYSDPFGHLDAVTSNSIRGWVWCVDLPQQSVPVTIYLKNKTTGEDYPPINLSGKDTALYRPDVHDGDYGTGCYGFNYPVDWTEYSAGEYEVSAKWHSMNGTGLVYDLFNSPKTYNNVGVRLSEQNLTLEIGQTATLTASSYIDSTTGWPLAWSSFDESVATVDSNGNITAVGSGTTVISAQYTRDYVASCTVTVPNLTDVKYINMTKDSSGNYTIFVTKFYNGDYYFQAYASLEDEWGDLYSLSQENKNWLDSTYNVYYENYISQGHSDTSKIDHRVFLAKTKLINALNNGTWPVDINSDEFYGMWMHYTRLEAHTVECAHLLAQIVDTAIIVGSLTYKTIIIAKDIYIAASSSKYINATAYNSAVSANSAFSSFDDSKAISEGITDGTSYSGKRPTWRQSEINASQYYPESQGYVYNRSYKFVDGKLTEVTYGTSGSVRPDYYNPKTKHCVDIKNYNISTSTNRNNLTNNVINQYNQRVSVFPSGTNFEVRIDVRGQSYSDTILKSIADTISSGTNGNMKVYFMK